MQTDLIQLIIDLLSNNDITLIVGENEYYFENDEYSLTIYYSLEKKDSYSFNFDYDFRINSIYLVDNNTGIEHEMESNEHIEKIMFNDAEIEDWSDYPNENIDSYIEENY